MNRRKFIGAVGAGTAIALAGCSNGGPLGGGGNDADTSSPTAIVESFYEKSDEVGSDASTDEVLDEIDPFLHSASPIPDLLREQEDSENNESQDRTLASVETETIEEDVDESGLREEYGLGVAGVSDSDISSIAEENAIVEANVEYEDANGQTARHVTATENGNWLIVF